MATVRQDFEATLIPAWEYWVVSVPDAEGAHAIVLDRANAEQAAREAVSVVLGVDVASISIVLKVATRDRAPARSASGSGDR